MSKKLTIPKVRNQEVMEQISAWVNEQLGEHPKYDDAKQAEIDKWGLPWFRAGAVVVHPGNRKILMIHEARVQVKKIKDPTLKAYYLNVEQKKGSDWVDGDGGWNLPSGRLRLGETFADGVIREVKEESAQRIALGEIIDVREGNDPSNLYIMPVYVATALSGPARMQTAEVSEIGWFSAEGIRALHDAGVLRSPEFVMNSLDAYERHCAQG